MTQTMIESRCVFVTCESEIVMALEWMLAKPSSERPFVVVNHQGGFVQFCTDDEGKVLFDVPGRKQNLPNYRRCAELLGDPILNPVGLSYQKRGLGSVEGAKIAIQIMQECQRVCRADWVHITGDVTGN